EEPPLSVRVEDGALFLSRNGLAKMGVALELEVKYGCGRGTLMHLHTAVLSCNQLKVLDGSVLTAMPALQHLDVSHNLLCRMEPLGGGGGLPVMLETLNMSNNRICRVGGIGHCLGLRSLNLRHNLIKSTLGLEHLSLLEQLDLSHNLIPKPMSVRPLSFNRGLKLLWLEGNPLANHPRYRPTLTCLLPHVLAIDCRGMPPNTTVGRASLSPHSGREERNRTDTGDVERGGGELDRRRQVERDEQRSNEWHRVIGWRERQAKREWQAKEQMAKRRHD
ncbi:unnamed protein product, partial [Discosporangium mesarthrocarpum]